MAGESPDRSKQRESSAEPTPGSAGPVPEARSATEDSAEKRDPRLPVGRDAASSSTPSESSASAKGSAGNVDTATRVLSVRDAQPDEEVREGREDREDEEASDSAESGSGAEEAAPDGRDDFATDGDGRLQAVAASWVRSADEAERTEQDGPGKGAESPRKAEDGDGDGTDEQDARNGQDGSESLDEGSGEASEADGDDESESDSEADADAEVTPEADADAEVTPEADADTAPVVADTPAADDDGDGTDTDATPEADEAAPEADANKASGTDDVDAESAVGTDEAEADETDEAAPGAPPTDQPTAVFKAPRPSAPAVDQPTTMLKLGDAAKDADKATEKTDDKADDKAAETDLDGEDGEDEAKTKDKGRSAPDPQPESAAERTSKFVPLKDLDDPDVRKAPRVGDSVTTALRVPPSASPAAASPVTSPAAATRSVPQVGPELTRQQPLPPKPPLDLLAELTNTPPPPETPLRTAVRRVKIWTPLAVLLVIVFAVVQSMRPLPTPALVLTAKDTHTFDGDQVKLPWPDEGQGWMSVDGIGAMDHFGEQKPVAIGSVAKTMTAYIILRDHPLKPGEEGPKIEIDPTAEKEGGYDQQGESTLNTVKAGDFLTQKQALSAVMIPSANNIARLLARWDAGSEEAFVEKMNATAKELGMTDTTYTDPSGLDKTTVSTAEDQVKLGIAAMRIPAMVAITSVASWTDPTGEYWSNHNQLPYTIGAIGLKTGNTTAAGGNLLFATRKKVDGQTVTIVGAILGQRKAQSTLDLVNAVSKTALLAAQEVPTSEKILKKGDVVGYVDDQLGGHTPVVVTKDVTAVGWAGLKVKLDLSADDITHTASAGTKVGMLTVGDGTEGSVEVPVQLQSDLAEPGFAAKLTRLG
ncbi:D-alanyl-D-alanine carboxypeptidase [Streptomyces sp. NWU339]|uniref:D-alanyl-D-alanine carboxypeptidase n=1 Tax=Streptomyces sp. NWU339 TaxID=2185284 RepID=UPI000D68086D|nr:D-alanyl-D-alanine carboxypeptidase [Streptomyces sp. NWU339]PWI07400.1 D-alanyl-D-alanine carboxypeptidase [Streptomyces sp. NWU339]